MSMSRLMPASAECQASLSDNRERAGGAGGGAPAAEAAAESTGHRRRASDDAGVQDRCALATSPPTRGLNAPQNFQLLQLLLQRALQSPQRTQQDRQKVWNTQAPSDQMLAPTRQSPTSKGIRTALSHPGHASTSHAAILNKQQISQ